MGVVMRERARAHEVRGRREHREHRERGGSAISEPELCCARRDVESFCWCASDCASCANAVSRCATRRSSCVARARSLDCRCAAKCRGEAHVAITDTSWALRKGTQARSNARVAVVLDRSDAWRHKCTCEHYRHATRCNGRPSFRLLHRFDLLPPSKDGEFGHLPPKLAAQLRSRSSASRAGFAARRQSHPDRAACFDLAAMGRSALRRAREFGRRWRRPSPHER